MSDVRERAKKRGVKKPMVKWDADIPSKGGKKGGKGGKKGGC